MRSIGVGSGSGLPRSASASTACARVFSAFLYGLLLRFSAGDAAGKIGKPGAEGALRAALQTAG